MDQPQYDESANLALEFIKGTSRHVFLTGKAGSGKTTFLKNLKGLTNKKIAIGAPTGIAAVNASGVTLHSLFQLPIGIFLPGKTKLPGNLSSEKRLLLREMELLVIDEVSMVRADLLDAIDQVLKETRKIPAPFGGIQVLYIGDLYQLSPVATGDELEKLGAFYDSLFFTSSNVFKESNPVCIELESIYRQKDPAFISVLNNIRTGSTNQEDINLLNSYCRKGSPTPAGFVTLVTHNQLADAINLQKLAESQGESIQVPAEIEGEFEVSSYPTDHLLQLKVGAQIMLLRNERGSGKKYFNGKMGVLEGIEEDQLTIEIDGKELVTIKKETWKNIHYEFDEKSGRMLETDLGSFTQFPVRLAWAVTIHKSQGLTFDRVVLDVQNVFAHGQAYVAFSRVRSLEGLLLEQPVQLDQINANASRPVFNVDLKERLTDILGIEKINFLASEVEKKLAWTRISEIASDSQGVTNGSDLFNIVNNWSDKQKGICEKFELEVKRIISSGDAAIYTTLKNRIAAACSYLKNEVNRFTEEVLAPAFKTSKDSVTQKLDHRFVSAVIACLRSKKKDILQLEQFVTGKSENAVRPIQPAKKVVNQPTLQTSIPVRILSGFNEGRTIKELADTLQLSVPSVENYLAELVRTGEIQIHQVVDQAILEQVIAFKNGKTALTPLALKSAFGDRLSFGQIKALINHLAQESI